MPAQTWKNPRALGDFQVPARPGLPVCQVRPDVPSLAGRRAGPARLANCGGSVCA